MIFYFTGTGNSLYVAKKFGENPISIPQVINNDNLTFNDDTIGIVCPVYCHKPPKIVIEFMKKATFNTNYFYMILTYGNRHGGVAEITQNIGKEYNIKIDYIKNILMVDNYLPVFDMNEQITIDKRVDEQINETLTDVSERKHYIPETTDADREVQKTLIETLKQMPNFNSGEQITVTNKCVGCGICEKVCPVGNFYIVNNKALRKKETCEFCLACANNCPQKAITMSIIDKNPNARYRNKNITLQEIIKSNNQF
ncbi:MAG: EFR1 family ferrodoxin [Lachnospirales bacterium]